MQFFLTFTSTKVCTYDRILAKKLAPLSVMKLVLKLIVDSPLLVLRDFYILKM